MDVEGTIASTSERILGCSQQTVELRVTKVTLHYIMLLVAKATLPVPAGVCSEPSSHPAATAD